MSEYVFDIELADEVKHLTHKEIEELYQKYLGGEKNSVLINEYNIDINPNKLVSILPPKILEDTICPYCDIPMFTKRRSKSASSWNMPPIECFECDHEIFTTDSPYRRQLCDCKNCIDIRIQQKNEEEKKQREKIQKIYCISNTEPVEYSKLSFIPKLILLTLFRMQTNEEFEHIISLDDPSRSERLSPTSDMDTECLEALFRSNVLIIDPDSRVDAFIKDKNYHSFYINKVRWIPNITFDGLERASLNETYQRVYNELKEGIQCQWEDEIFKTLFKISREEVIQYIYVKSDELNINFTAENKTREIINQLLMNFSVCQIYYFVKKAVENAHIYYSKGFAKNKSHAANTIPNKILSLGERAISEQWDTYKYNRDSRAPRSYISKVFYDFLLHDEDSGFIKSPGKHWDQEILPKFFKKSDKTTDSLKCSQCGSNNIKVKMLESKINITCKDCDSTNEFAPSNQSIESD